MNLAIFVLIAWIIITVYLLVPKKLNLNETILLFFFYTIITITIFTIIDLNLKLIQHSNKTESFISLWVHRNIIIPMSLIILVNLILTFTSKVKKYISIILSFSVLYSIDLLAYWLGQKTYHGSNQYFASAILDTTLILIAYVMMKLVKKLPEGEST